ncbi:HNH endonuclease [Burkholderia ubonensis]|uniref:HNH endonuclease n=2 Tax=Burkholderia ubonensis TaxID=101571 RepID=UPI000ACBA045|nr:HNH endonuclease [Burkholderia ubonensis]
MTTLGKEFTASDISTRNCIYCDRDKPITEFSLEHIFPDSLGGSLCCDLFKTRQVCQRCNNLSGLFIDGPFIKSWFRNNHDAVASRDYLTLDAQDSTLPLIYMGEIGAISTTDEVCESWLGPCGEHVYHFHRRDDERFATYLGGDPIARQKDTGRAYLALTVTHPWWIGLALRSFKAHFRRARRYALNFHVTDDRADSPFLHAPDERTPSDIAKIQSLGNGTRHINMSIGLNAEARFMAKIARAIGYNLFGDEFLATPYAAHLKDAMWEQDHDRAATIPVYGTGFWGTVVDSIKDLLSWRGAYTIVLSPGKDRFGLHLTTPAGRSAHIAVSDDPSLWREMSTVHAGQVYVLAPQAKKFVGPIPLLEYAAHVTGSWKQPALLELEACRLDPSLLPPRNQTEQPA